MTFHTGAKLIVDLSAIDILDGMTLDIISTAAARAIVMDDISSNTWFEVSGAAGWNPSTFTWEIVNKADSKVLTLTIPEPSMFGLLAGLGAIALVSARRRRKA